MLVQVRHQESHKNKKIRAMSKKTALFNEQYKITSLMVLWRIPTFITSFVAACASSSIVIWLEFLENASIILPGVLLLIFTRKLNKNLKFKYNYGTDKVESVTALCCEMFDLHLCGKEHYKGLRKGRFSVIRTGSKHSGVADRHRCGGEGKKACGNEPQQASSYGLRQRREGIRLRRDLHPDPHHRYDFCGNRLDKLPGSRRNSLYDPAFFSDPGASDKESPGRAYGSYSG